MTRIDRFEQAPAAEPSAADTMLRLDRQLCFVLYAASNRITRLYRPLLEPLGLTYPQYLTMLVLWERTPRTVGELGQMLDLDSGTLTPLLKRLESAGFVRRHRDPADERRVLVELTEQGRDLRLRAANVPASLLCQVDMPVQEVADLRERIKHLISAIDKPKSSRPSR